MADNIRQRGDVGGSAKKIGLRIKELERIYGIREGRPEKLPNNSVVKSQSDIASQMGMSMQTLQNYKKLTEMIPELEELVDTGIVSDLFNMQRIKAVGSMLAAFKYVKKVFCRMEVFHIFSFECI